MYRHLRMSIVCSLSPSLSTPLSLFIAGLQTLLSHSPFLWICHLFDVYTFNGLSRYCTVTALNRRLSCFLVFLFSLFSWCVAHRPVQSQAFSAVGQILGDSVLLQKRPRFLHTHFQYYPLHVSVCHVLVDSRFFFRAFFLPLFSLPAYRHLLYQVPIDTITALLYPIPPCT